jgi:predicted dehydrogenase
MGEIRMGIIGFGYWGPNLARIFFELPSSELVGIADLKEDQLARAKAKYPHVTLDKDYKALFELKLDAVVIATPPSTHFKIAKDCLLHDLHVLIEKPMTDNSKDAEELIELADARGLTLMVGHTFEYNTAVLALKQYIESKELGDIYYLDTARLNLGLYQRKSNVLWDLATHDISILLFLLDKKPVSVSAQGAPCVIPGVYDVAYLNLLFADNLTAYVHVSWLDPCKVRRVTVVGSKKMAVFNDMEAEGKIKIYDKGVIPPPHTDGFGEHKYNYRSGDITIPNIPYKEPLREECIHFIDNIVNHTEPRSSGSSGLRVIKILEAAHRSIVNASSHELIQW